MTPVYDSAFSPFALRVGLKRLLVVGAARGEGSELGMRPLARSLPR